MHAERVPMLDPTGARRIRASQGARLSLLGAGLLGLVVVAEAQAPKVTPKPTVEAVTAEKDQWVTYANQLEQARGTVEKSLAVCTFTKDGLAAVNKSLTAANEILTKRVAELEKK